MLQVKVNLREYPKFFSKMQIAALKYAGQRRCSTAEELLEVEFNIPVKVYPHDQFGVVTMDEATHTWFELQWS